MRIIFPGHSYDEALQLANCTRLSDRRNETCMNTLQKIAKRAGPLVEHVHRRTGGWGWGGCSPPNFLRIYLFGQKLSCHSGNDVLVTRRIYWSTMIKRSRSIVPTSSTFTCSIMHGKSEMQCLCIFMNTIDRIAGSNMLRKVKF